MKMLSCACLLKKLKDKKLMFGFLKEYFIVIVILLIATSIIFRVMSVSLKAQVAKVNSVLLQNSLSAVEKEFGNLDEIAGMISYSSKINRYFIHSAQDSVEERYLAYEIIRDLNGYVKDNNFIENIFIFFENDRVISDTTRSNTDFFFNVLHKNHGKINSLLPFYYYKQLISDPVEKVDELRDTLYYINTLPLGNKNDPKALMIFHLNTDLIKEIIDNNRISSETTVTINNVDGVRIFADTKNNLEALYAQDSGDFVTEMLFSDTLALEINSYTPKALFEKNIIEVNNIILLVLGIALMFGLITGGYFSYSKYVSFSKLMSVFGINDVILNEKNIFRLIEKNIMSTVTENEKLKTQVNEQLEAVNNSVIEKLLTREYGSDEEIQELSGFSGAEFDGIEFFAGSIRIISNDIKSYLYYSGIIKDLQKILDEDQKGYVYFINKNNITLLIKISGGMNFQYKDTLHEIEEYFNSREIYVHMGIGSIYGKLHKINDSYKEALACLNHISGEKSSQTLLFEEIEEQYSDKIEYYYPLNMEGEIINCVKSGNIQKLRGVLSKIYNLNYKEIQLSGEISGILLNNIIGTAIKIMEELNMSMKSFTKLNILTLLEKNNSANDVFLILIDVFTYICEFVNSGKKSSNVYLFDNIIAYLEEDFDNCNISLQYVADKYGLNSSYLSRFFKDQSGMNFNDYIQKLRIDKAKEMLTGDLSLQVQEIANIVGYNSAGTLIRIFKKHEGISPGEFRDNELYNVRSL